MISHIDVNDARCFFVSALLVEFHDFCQSFEAVSSYWKVICWCGMVCSARGWKKGISVVLRWTDLMIVSVDMVMIALPLAPTTWGRRKRSKIEFNLWLQPTFFNERQIQTPALVRIRFVWAWKIKSEQGKE